MAPLEGIAAYVKDMLEDIQTNIFRKALEYRDSMIRKVDTYEEFKTEIEKGGFILAHGSDSKTNRHTLDFVICKFEAGTLVFSIVILNADTHAFEFLYYRSYHSGYFGKLLFILVNRHNNHLYRSKMRRKNECDALGDAHTYVPAYC